MRKNKNKMKLGIFVIVLALLILCSFGIERTVGPSTHKNNYTTTINRVFQNETERELISLAENITPPDGNWKCHTVDRIIITDAVNIDAINYYSGLIEQFKQDPNNSGFHINSAHFKYDAKVEYIINNGEYNTSKRDLIKVNLTMDFSMGCGNVCGMDFHHYRTVIFDTDHIPVLVLGDDICPAVKVA